MALRPSETAVSGQNGACTMAMNAARLTVTRDGPDDVGDRQILLSLDSEHWTTLRFGESATRELPPGRHHLKLFLLIGAPLFYLRVSRL